MSLTPISQKAHDIAHATFRVATLVRNNQLRSELENAGIGLVARYEDASIEKLERLVSFAESIGEMKPVNASVLKKELNNLQTAIDFHANTFKGSPILPNGNIQDIDISSMFPASQAVAEQVHHKQANNENSRSSTNGNPASQAIAGQAQHRQAIAGQDNGEITVRQTAILRNIRETEFCRLRNIIEAMPNISERTIRNDIQALIAKDLIRRVGGGGPNSYFETMELSLRQGVEA